MSRLSLGGLALLLATGMPAFAQVQVERTWMPRDAAPSSFAIGLPGGTSFCFDPSRPGVSYTWQGGFIDLKSVRPGPGKEIKPVTLLGDVTYQETGVAPLRCGDPARVPVTRFLGYTLGESTVEFRYAVDDRVVHESVRADGAGRVVRRVRIPDGAKLKWFYARAGMPVVSLTLSETGEGSLPSSE